MTLHQKIAQQDQRVAEYEEMMLAAFDSLGEFSWRKHAACIITEAMQLRQAFPANDACVVRALLVGYAMERFNRLLAERQLAHAEEVPEAMANDGFCPTCGKPRRGGS